MNRSMAEVYASWIPIDVPLLIGQLTFAESNRGGVFSFDEYYRWVKILISPGSSLGGARPKACVTDSDNHLWIAKFPNQSDTFDVGAWEMVCYELALAAQDRSRPTMA